MISLKRNKLWVVLAVVLSMVFTIAGTPAAVFACADGDASAIVTASSMHGHAAPAEVAAGEHCAAMAKPGPCCCAPRGERAAADAPDTNSALSQPGCGCSMGAPTAPPPAKPAMSVLTLQFDVVLLTSAPVSLDLPRQAPWVFAAPSTGPPRAPQVDLGPSRAPPAR